jgi:hypothetical protein
MKSFGICSIATNGYEKYLLDSISSFLNLAEKEYFVNWYIFSDVTESLKNVLKNEKNIVFHFFPINSYGWPEATLLRYQIYAEHIEFMNSDYLMHLDADMLFLPSFTFPDIEDQPDLMHFVLHPGFSSKRWNISRPFELSKRFLRTVVIGGQGSWETRRISKAYTPRGRRKHYFCGGIWFGKKVVFSSFVTHCETLVSADQNSGIIAKWHDESHLNRFAAFNDVCVLGSQYCFDGKIDLGDVAPFVLAVEK